MTFGDLVLKLIFLVQTGIGVLGNAFLLLTYASTFCPGRALRPVNLIFTNMVVANFLVLLVKGIPQILYIWGVTHILDNTGCKLVFYIHRVARGLSLCTTCLLSTFQAITISSRTAGWMGLKDRALRSTGSSCFLCWISNLLINIFIPTNLEAPWRSHNYSNIQSHGLCFSEIPSPVTITRHIIVMTVSDAVFMGLMIGTSVYMVLLLCRHHQRVRHVHTLRNAHRLSPESKATQTILLLASTFILFYLTNSIVTFYNVFFTSHTWLPYASSFLTACYPTLNPLILLLRYSQTSRFCS
ncbi:PREDICTED: vomeronasal type-1 receptor 4-like [Miniopterus natalensis]|uniref:vomeronasal type-1 receptor 4-like n=1 Tax=Miniopterus natalensis TaxID=291302 RepID=UPI0007A6E213|nr:PREDICTED: vomeronasal type-1 receptor 4-like [Miniopterus natalensis]XP_016072702.1 PREDICTED: vomeronasal type-1 receptor 4-like [Miniopterus natalensis]XP_016072703.1 PREDICTED: vomeronasal type-1 receptor 4-like [Miniopterus natalensis]